MGANRPQAFDLLLQRLQRRDIGGLSGRIRGRPRAQRTHKLGLKQRRLRGQRLKLFGEAAKSTRDSRRHFIASRRDNPRRRGRRRPGGRPNRLPDLGQVPRRYGQSFRCRDHIRRHLRAPVPGAATISRQLRDDTRVRMTRQENRLTGSPRGQRRSTAKAGQTLIGLLITLRSTAFCFAGLLLDAVKTREPNRRLRDVLNRDETERTVVQNANCLVEHRVRFSAAPQRRCWSGPQALARFLIHQHLSTFVGVSQHARAAVRADAPRSPGSGPC